MSQRSNKIYLLVVSIFLFFPSVLLANVEASESISFDSETEQRVLQQETKQESGYGFGQIKNFITEVFVEIKRWLCRDQKEEVDLYGFPRDLSIKDLNVLSVNINPVPSGIGVAIGVGESGDPYPGFMPNFIQEDKKKREENFAELKKKDDPVRDMKEAGLEKKLRKEDVKRRLKKAKKYVEEKEQGGSLLGEHKKLSDEPKGPRGKNKLAENYDDNLNLMFIRPGDEKDEKDKKLIDNLDLESKYYPEGMIVRYAGGEQKTVKTIEKLRAIESEGTRELNLQIHFFDLIEQGFVAEALDLVAMMLREDRLVVLFVFGGRGFNFFGEIQSRLDYPVSSLQELVVYASVIRSEQIEVLKLFPSLVRLNLFRNNLGLEEIRALKEISVQFGSLRGLGLCCEHFDLGMIMELCNLLENAPLLFDLSLAQCDLNEVMMRRFAVSLPTHLRSLNLSQNDLGLGGMLELCKILPRLSFLHNLDLSHTSQTSEGLSELVRVVPFMHRLETLNLGGNDLGSDEAEVRPNFLQPSYVGFFGWNMELDSTKESSDLSCLLQSPFLKSLTFSECNLSLSDAKKLSGALERNSNLVFLDVSGNGFEVEGDFRISLHLLHNHRLSIVGLDKVYSSMALGRNEMDSLKRDQLLHRNYLLQRACLFLENLAKMVFLGRSYEEVKLIAEKNVEQFLNEEKDYLSRYPQVLDDFIRTLETRYPGHLKADSDVVYNYSVNLFIEMMLFLSDLSNAAREAEFHEGWDYMKMCEVFYQFFRADGSGGKVGLDYFLAGEDFFRSPVITAAFFDRLSLMCRLRSDHLVKQGSLDDKELSRLYGDALLFQILSYAERLRHDAKEDMRGGDSNSRVEERRQILRFIEEFVEKYEGKTEEEVGEDEGKEILVQKFDIKDPGKLWQKIKEFAISSEAGKKSFELIIGDKKRAAGFYQAVVELVMPEDARRVFEGVKDDLLTNIISLAALKEGREHLRSKQEVGDVKIVDEKVESIRGDLRFLMELGVLREDPRINSVGFVDLESLRKLLHDNQSIVEMFVARGYLQDEDDKRLFSSILELLSDIAGFCSSLELKNVPELALYDFSPSRGELLFYGNGSDDFYEDFALVSPSTVSWVLRNPRGFGARKVYQIALAREILYNGGLFADYMARIYESMRRFEDDALLAKYFREARAVWRSAIEKRLISDDLVVNYMRVLGCVGRFDVARTVFNRFREVAASMMYAVYVGLAIKDGDFMAAKEAYQEALAKGLVDESFRFVHSGYIDMATDAEDFLAAKEAYVEAEKVGSLDRNIYMKGIVVAKASDDYDMAKSVFDKFVRCYWKRFEDAERLQRETKGAMIYGDCVAKSEVLSEVSEYGISGLVFPEFTKIFMELAAKNRDYSGVKSAYDEAKKMEMIRASNPLFLDDLKGDFFEIARRAAKKFTDYELLIDACREGVKRGFLSAEVFVADAEEVGDIELLREAHYRRIMEELKSGNFMVARAAYRRAIEMGLCNDQVVICYMKAAINDGDLEEAQAACLEALSRGMRLGCGRHDLFAVHIRLARNNGGSAAAKKVLSEVLEIDFKDKENFLENYVREAIKDDDDECVWEGYGKAVKIKAVSFCLFEDVITYAGKKGDFSAVQRVYGEAMERGLRRDSSDEVEPVVLYAKALIDAARLREAVVVFPEIIEGGFGDYKFFAVCLAAAINVGDFPAALGIYNEAIRRAKDQGEFRWFVIEDASFFMDFIAVAREAEEFEVIEEVRCQAEEMDFTDV